MVRLSFSEIRTKAVRRPKGYLEDVLRAAHEVTDTHVLLTEEKWKELVHKYTVEQAAPTKTPTMLDLVTNFAGSVSAWAKAGFPVVKEEDYKLRMSICAKCPQWKPSVLDIDALGTCKLCGCTGFKPWLGTEKCPVDKW